MRLLAVITGRLGVLDDLRVLDSVFLLRPITKHRHCDRNEEAEKGDHDGELDQCEQKAEKDDKFLQKGERQENYCGNRRPATESN